MNVWDESPLPAPGDADQPTPDAPPAPETADAGDGGAGTPPSSPPDAAPEPDPEPHDERALFQRVAGIPAWLLLALAVAIWVGVAAALIIPSGNDPLRSDTPQPVASPAPTSPPRESTPGTAVVITSPPPTSEPASTDPSNEPISATTDAPVETTPATVAPTTETTTSEPATTEATSTTEPPTATSAPATTTTVPATTTTTPVATTTTDPPAPTITISESSTVVGADGQSLTVVPRRSECRYGPECFVVSFTIDGFATQPQEFVCEFSSGARYVFRFSSAGADPACSTLDVPDTIVVEVAGLRSEPATIDD